MNRFLKSGDRIRLKKGTKVYAKMPSCFIYENTPCSMEIAETDIRIGEVRRRVSPKVKEGVKQVVEALEGSLGLKVPSNAVDAFIRANMPTQLPDRLDTAELAGTYRVIKTKTQGGGTGMGPHDTYPDGHYVIAEAEHPIVDQNLPKQVAFYQSGSFTAMIDPSEVDLV